MDKRQRVVVLGGGVGGLSAGWMLSRTGHYDVTLVEKSPVVGGLCGTFTANGFSLDYGPHKIYSVIPGILDETTALLDGELIRHKKKNTIRLFDSNLDYPLKLSELAFKMGLKNIVEATFSMAAAKAKGGRPVRSYEDYIVAKFGRKLYSLVFEPLAEKTWGDPSTLSADIARTRIPSQGFVDVLARMCGLKKEDHTTDAAYFFYPKGGFFRLPERMAEEIGRHGGRVLTSSRPLRAVVEGRRVTGVELQTPSETQIIPCDLLISALPLDALLGVLPEEGWDKSAAVSCLDGLALRTTFLVYIFSDGEPSTAQHWMFFPGRDVIFGRVFEQKNLDPSMGPAGKNVVCCDFTDSPDGPLAKASDKDLADRCAADLVKVGLLKKGAVTNWVVRRYGEFYPRYELDHKETSRRLFGRLKTFENLLLTGRAGFYNYNNSDHCLDMGRFIAEGLEGGKSPNAIWEALETRVENYRIVD
jgi:protoporphyrinogen oxidase